MIKNTELRKFRPTVKYQNGKEITLKAVQKAIKNYAMKMGVPVAFTGEQIKSYGLFRASVETCFVMYHPRHKKDYFKFCIRVKKQGTCAFVSIHDFGQSSKMKKIDAEDIGGKTEAEIEEEQIYYQNVFKILDEVVS